MVGSQQEVTERVVEDLRYLRGGGLEITWGRHVSEYRVNGESVQREDGWEVAEGLHFGGIEANLRGMRTGYITSIKK